MSAEHKTASQAGAEEMINLGNDIHGRPIEVSRDWFTRFLEDRRDETARGFEDFSAKLK